MAAGNPLSFLHASKPEIDFPPGTDVYSPEVYAKGKENFQKLITQGALKQDGQPSFYLYRQIMGPHAQVGLVAAASCEEYLNGVIKKSLRGNGLFTTGFDYPATVERLRREIGDPTAP